MKTFSENAALELMRSGQCLVRMHTRHGARWFLSDGQVSDATAEKLVMRSDVGQLDPGLFAGHAQTYLLRSCSHA
jgi:hypothetical protein